MAPLQSGSDVRYLRAKGSERQEKCHAGKRWNIREMLYNYPLVLNGQKAAQRPGHRVQTKDLSNHRSRRSKPLSNRRRVCCFGDNAYRRAARCREGPQASETVDMNDRKLNAVNINGDCCRGELCPPNLLRALTLSNPSRFSA